MCIYARDGLAGLALLELPLHTAATERPVLNP